ncbi:NusG domain II-containing protein [Eubacteriales bacterium OttesenSCG-928-G02]|nr:NusG domain II-containing protein [Eubacteriales bacterium OttesenSCG-928-G02]
MLKKIDIIIILAILFTAVLLFFAFNSGGDGTEAVIEIDGKLYKTISLSEKDEYIIVLAANGIHIKISVKNNSIGFLQSDCTDKTCISFGMLSKAGQMATCLPARVNIRITGKKKIDAVTG